MISEWILILTVCPRGCTRCCKYTTFSETGQIPSPRPYGSEASPEICVRELAFGDGKIYVPYKKN